MSAWDSDAWAARQLERWRLEYEQGYKRALLYSLNFCLMNNVPVPPWIKQGLSKAMDAVHSYEIKSWEDVFGELLPKGKWRATEQRNAKMGWDLFQRVCDLHKAGASIDAGLFEKVGEEFGVSKTVASDLYYAVSRDFAYELKQDALDRGTSEEN